MKKENHPRKFNIAEVTRRGDKIYQKLKGLYEPKERGRYLAINVNNGRAYIGDTGVGALKRGLKEWPSHFFFLQKIGFDATEFMGGFDRLN